MKGRDNSAPGSHSGILVSIIETPSSSPDFQGCPGCQLLTSGEERKWRIDCLGGFLGPGLRVIIYYFCPHSFDQNSVIQLQWIAKEAGKSSLAVCWEWRKVFAKFLLSSLCHKSCVRIIRTLVSPRIHRFRSNFLESQVYKDLLKLLWPLLAHDQGKWPKYGLRVTYSGQCRASYKHLGDINDGGLYSNIILLWNSFLVQILLLPFILVNFSWPQGCVDFPGSAKTTLKRNL